MTKTQCSTPEAVSIDDVVRLLEVTMSTERATAALSDEVVDVARGVLDAVDATACSRYDRPIVILGAITLASRRTGRVELTPEEVATAVGIDAERVATADEQFAAELSPPAAKRDRTAIRRTLIVANELLAAAEHDRLHAFSLPPGSPLADAAPELLARADQDDTDRDEDDSMDRARRDGELTAAKLQAHVDRLEADLELARLGTDLYGAVQIDDPDGEIAYSNPSHDD